MYSRFVLLSLSIDCNLFGKENDGDGDEDDDVCFLPCYMCGFNVSMGYFVCFR